MLNIGIIGGSIAGCIAAALLERAGHSVNVYERSKRGLIGRGGGVATSRRVIEDMRALDLLDEDFPASFFDTLHLSKVTPDTGHLGRCPFKPELDMHCVNWASLWESLRSRVPDASYHRGETLIAASETDAGIDLEFDTGTHRRVDLVLFADGYQSFGRKLLFPDVPLVYRGYTVWRGVLPESAVADRDPLTNHPRFSFRSAKGSYVSYVMPAANGSTTPGDRIINWACYIPLPQADLGMFMVDRDGIKRAGSIPGGSMRPEQDADLKTFARDQLPTYYADILEKSTNNQIQLIYTDMLPAYRKGRMCLIGDAGMVVQPLTGSGLFKSLSNARDLVGALANGPLEHALDKWSRVQTNTAHKMHGLGDALEKAFIWDTIDFATATPTECQIWWDKAVTIPDEFSYFAPPGTDQRGAA